jgi:hypothetical protein
MTPWPRSRRAGRSSRRPVLTDGPRSEVADTEHSLTLLVSVSFTVTFFFRAPDTTERRVCDGGILKKKRFVPAIALMDALATAPRLRVCLVRVRVHQSFLTG